MFEMQAVKHNFRKNVATDENYILRNMCLKFQNSKSGISCNSVLYIFCYKSEPFGVKRSMRHNCMLQFLKKLKGLLSKPPKTVQ